MGNEDERRISGKLLEGAKMAKDLVFGSRFGWLYMRMREREQLQMECVRQL